MKTLSLFVLFLVTTASFGQKSKYWIRFKDKNLNAYSLGNPQQFLSQKSLERRTRQGISLNETDLPLSEVYVDSVSPYITKLVHRIKWFNLIVVDMDSAIKLNATLQTWRDTTVTADTFSKSVYDTVIIYRRINVHGAVYTRDTTSTLTTVIRTDTFQHAGPIYYRDTFIITDFIVQNNFDSLKRLACIDTIAEIAHNPTRSAFSRNKNEDVHPVDQSIIYPSKYGAAYHQINMLNADLLHQMGYRGAGITISSMDNGFYQADVIAAYDSVRPRILGTWDFVNNEANVYNDGSHGENTFSCMAANVPDKFIGTAPDASFYLFVTEDDGAEWVMEEYNWAAAAIVADSVGAQIFSTSLGYTEFDNHIGDHTYHDLDGHTTVITNAGNMAFSKGILVVNSAGNEGANSWFYVAAPADGDSVLAIGAVDSAREVANFSSRGPAYGGKIKPDVCAMGEFSAVISTPDGNPGYSSGTSFSCPILAGCAASLWSAFPEKTAREIHDAIVASADHYYKPDSAFGYGIPNFYNAYLALKAINPVRAYDGAAVYPNPFTNQINVMLFGTEAGVHKIDLFDLQGKKVYSQEIYVRDKTFAMINPDVVSGLSAGEYILCVDGKKNTTCLVKAK